MSNACKVFHLIDRNRRIATSIVTARLDEYTCTIRRDETDSLHPISEFLGRDGLNVEVVPIDDGWTIKPTLSNASNAWTWLHANLEDPIEFVRKYGCCTVESFEVLLEIAGEQYQRLREAVDHSKAIDRRREKSKFEHAKEIMAMVVVGSYGYYQASVSENERESIVTITGTFREDDIQAILIRINDYQSLVVIEAQYKSADIGSRTCAAFRLDSDILNRVAYQLRYGFKILLFN